MKRESRTSLPPAGEPIDGLLGAFFRSEMPSPWPAFRRPAPARAARRAISAGRLALAASVALLFAGTWLLPVTLAPRPRQGATLPTVGPASAGRGGLVPTHLRPAAPGPNKLMIGEDAAPK